MCGFYIVLPLFGEGYPVNLTYCLTFTKVIVVSSEPPEQKYLPGIEFIDYERKLISIWRFDLEKDRDREYNRLSQLINKHSELSRNS